MRIFLILIVLIILAGAGVGSLVALYHIPWSTGEPGPAQPIAFSHRVHAGENQIHCVFCHSYVEVSRRAGIPDMETCKNCHVIIGRDRPEVRKLMEYWKNKEPVPWVKVHDLPDHVYFTHRMHVRAGLACAECHGDVASMDQLERVSSLKMGWCLDCHKKNKASIDCWTCHI